MPFSVSPIIFSYTRADALADGVLIDLSHTAKSYGSSCRLPSRMRSIVDIWSRWRACLVKGNPWRDVSMIC